MSVTYIRKGESPVGEYTCDFSYSGSGDTVLVTISQGETTTMIYDGPNDDAAVNAAIWKYFSEQRKRAS